VIDKEGLSTLGNHASIMKAFYDRIEKVHKKPLHSGQIQIARDYYRRTKRIIMSQWGRNGGKTETALFIACTACALNDNFIVYIITPERKQGKEIYWAPKRLQNYPPPEFIATDSSTELRLTFKNNSFICVDGCENYNGHRGLKPNLVIYDEFQNHNREFHLEVMAPNLLGKEAALIIFGTPPKDRAAFYVEFHENLMKQVKEGDVTRSYYEFPTSINPCVSTEELAKTRKELIESDNEVIWLREYEGKMAFGGADVIFPKWDPRDHWKRHSLLMSYLETDRRKLKWYTICDPGTSTCFAVLFLAYNPYTQQVFVLDEIYEKDRKRTDTAQIWARIRAKEKELYPDAPDRTWKRYYDEAAAWFANEVSANYKEALSPSQKQKSDEETDISRIKILMSHPGALNVSDRCYWFRWEVESFITDENGNYPDKNNHLIDTLKYFVQVSNWKMIEKGADLVLPDGPVRVVQAATPIAPNEWADMAVEGSLEPDMFSGYFDFH
jgi:hypothetical protein